MMTGESGGRFLNYLVVVRVVGVVVVRMLIAVQVCVWYGWLPVVVLSTSVNVLSMKHYISTEIELRRKGNFHA